ncbi:hypothetical protein WN55_10484 [Dufourea novaeangliae]|uniref:Uncharacterized protein n=1 Tax=Dufourea novaeangliae TaxID=178035 RepID=A0A154P410_DUFNO|nr:hypothetical protein WN55_10484 [Dufourea novaeangliae]
MDTRFESLMDLERSDASVDGRDDRVEEVTTRSRSGSTRSLANCVLSGNERAEITAGAKQDLQEAAVTFYLFFCGTVLLTVSCMLLSSGVWCLLIRLPVIYLVQGPTGIVVALSGYIVAAGALTFPASCFLYREHNVTRPRRPLLLDRGFINTAAANGPVAMADRGVLRFGTLRERINAALTARLRDYPKYAFVWDLMQILVRRLPRELGTGSTSDPLLKVLGRNNLYNVWDLRNPPDLKTRRSFCGYYVYPNLELWLLWKTPFG